MVNNFLHDLHCEIGPIKLYQTLLVFFNIIKIIITTLNESPIITRRNIGTVIYINEKDGRRFCQLNLKNA